MNQNYSFLSIPKMGESVSEATIQNWLVKEGDVIEKDKAYLEVSTDKVDSEIPSPYKCKLIKILIQNNETIKIGLPIAEIELLEEVKNADTIQLNQVKTITDNTSTLSKVSKIERIENSNLSPLVRKIFLKNGIELSEYKNIQGTGNEGRVTKQDALNYIKNRSLILENIMTPVSTFKPVEETLNIETGDEKVEFDRMRAIIAKHMTDSRLKSAHCTSFTEVDVTDIVAFRDKEKEAFFDKHSLKLTYTHLFMYLIIDALKKFPKLNAHNYSKGYILKNKINLGFATALPNGNLIVPNIKHIDEMDLVTIVQSVNTIAEFAKKNSLQPEDIQNGTFTMSNTGIFGSLMGTPIINQPQVAIMSLGEILKTPAVVERDGVDSIEVRKKMILSLSYDHRIIDGAYAASFLKYYKELIEKFEIIL